MIYLGSRYAGSQVQVTSTSDGSLIRQFVMRQGAFSVDAPAQSSSYIWRDGDRIDRVALSTLGNSSLWWQIADANPEITDPMDIPVGTVVRIPK